jgi:hypothetical protein
LAGLGANFSFHPIPEIAMDAGLGIAFTGARIGVRARYNILKGEWTPFIGGGMTYSNGTDGKTVEAQSNGEKAELEVFQSAFAQAVAGLNYTGPEGFVFMATTGYSFLLNGPNTRRVSGPETAEAYDNVKVWYRGGLIVSAAGGYAF